MTDSTGWIDDELVSLGEFAEVWRPQRTRSAPRTENRRRALVMSRRRDSRFPEPRSTSGRGERFRLGDLIAWASQRGSDVDLAADWLAVLAVRSVSREHGPDAVRRFVAGALLTRRPRQSYVSARTAELASVTAHRLTSRLSDRTGVAHLEEHLDAALAAGVGTGELFEKLLAVVSPPRTVAASSTPEGLARVLVAIGCPRSGEVVYDPAIGEGMLALCAASAADGPIRVVGGDTDRDALEIAVARLLVHGVDFEPGGVSVDAAAGTTGPIRADMVLLDPPLRGDLRPWVRVAVENLAPNGRAVISLPWRSLEPDSGIWAAVPHGTVEAVTLLPDRLRTDTGDPLAVWSLRLGRTTGEVLLLDARNLGSRDGARRTVPDNDVDLIAKTVSSWQAGRRYRLPEAESRILQASEVNERRGDLQPINWLVEPDRSAELREAAELARRLEELLDGPLSNLATDEYRRALGRLSRTVARQRDHNNTAGQLSW